MTDVSDPAVSETVWDDGPKTQPIEVWLSQPRFEVACTVVYEDERTHPFEINSLSMRGAQREVTGFLIERGYTPAGRWEIERLGEADREEAVIETSRRFRPRTVVANLLEPEQDESGLTITAAGKTGTDTGTFYVYENWTNTFATVHRGSCSFCNEGQGVQRRGNETPNGRWHGSFSTFDEAVTAARQAANGHPNGAVWSVRPCGICLRAELRALVEASGR